MRNPNEDSKANNNSLILLLATLLALLAGGVGGYFAYSFFMTPGLLSLNEVTPDLMNRTRPIIQEAKKVVVEQNDQIQNVASNLSNNLLAINLKNEVSLTGWQKNYYDTNDRVGEAVPITSDGWLITNANQLSADLGRAAKKYVIISKDGTIYEIENVVKNNFTNTTFVKIASRNLSVSKFAESPLGKNGNLLVAATYDGGASSFYQVSTFIGTTTAIKSADSRNEEIKLNQKAENYLALVNLAGEIEAISSPTGVYSSRTINKDFASLLKHKAIKRPSLGFSYLDEHTLTKIGGKTSEPKYLILYNDTAHAWPKNGPALLSGLKSNDAILAVNGIELTASNKEGLFDAAPGESLELTIKRLDQTLKIDLKVSEIR